MDEPWRDDQQAGHVAEADLLREFLAGRDVSCPACGYNLRDLVGDVCPECGDRIKLSVRLTEPRQASLIAGLIALSAGAGMNVLLLIYAIIVTLFLRSMGGELGKFVTINIVEGTVMGVMLLAWVHEWNRVRRLPPTQRWGLVSCCCAATLIDVVVFTVVIH